VQINQVQATMQKIAQFQSVVKNTLKEGHDYGIIPGTGSKPTLLKPGAEKIIMLMGITSEYELIERIQDYETGFFAFTVRCILYRQGQKITEGLGHANTREKRYTSGKQQDAFTLANTVLKMAKKRAQVDATLTVASLSEIFTQDIEDLADGVIDTPAPTKSNTGNTGNKASDAQLRAIHSIGKRIHNDRPAEEVEEWLHILAKERFDVDSLKDLTKQQASQFIEELQSMTA